MSKGQIVEAMSRFSNLERNKSILGKINIENDISSKILDRNTDERKDKGKNKYNIGFFSLDETEFKFKKADWLDAICF